VRDALARYAVRATHVLVVEVPGHWLTRAALERAASDRGWQVALSPADADVLAVCGSPGPQLASLVDRLWGQMPGPRARVQADGTAEVTAALDLAAAGLLDTARQYDDSRSRPPTQSPDAEGGMDHGGRDHGGGDSEGMDHGDMDHGDMDHGDMDMAPGGIPLAQGGEDRDGLEMDVLHVRLGPVLASWPAGLTLRCSLQGDVIVEAKAGLVDGDRHSHSGHDDPRGQVADGTTDSTGARTYAARRCDSAAGLLALAGWDDAAWRARRLRDRLLADRDTDATPAPASTPESALESSPGSSPEPTAEAARVRAAVADLRRRVSRSRMLRWSMRGLRPLDDADLEGHGLPGHLRGDTHDRLVRMLDRAVEALEGAPSTGRPEEQPVSVEAVPHLVRGLDLATARLVVASLDLDLIGVGHGEVTRA
jgi:hypothetical protein